MKSLLLPLLTATALLTAGNALAQDKPVLNTAPPGATPPPAQQPAPQPAAPAPASPEPAATPAPAPSTDKPSGLDLPSDRDTRAAGGSSSALSRKLFIYSNFGLGFSSVNNVSQFNFSIAPALGYRVTERFAIGPGLSYSYVNYSLPKGYVFNNGSNSISSSNIGVKAFAQFIIYNEFFAHAEYELTRAELLGEDSNGNLVKSTKMIGSPLAGIGYRQSISDRVAADIVLLYNFDNTLYSLYRNPVIRFSFLFNLGR